jgi:thioredoxin-dependent peroxiredoxin
MEGEIRHLRRGSKAAHGLAGDEVLAGGPGMDPLIAGPWNAAVSALSETSHHGELKLTAIAEGSTAPDFDLETPDGRVKLADFAGRVVVLYFYPKDDTPGCTKEAQAFTDLAGDFAKAAATVVGVSKDSVTSHRKFAGKYALGVTLGSDPEGVVIERYGSWVEKSMYGRSYMGIDRSTFMIRDGRVERIWRKVKVPNHAAEVLKAVQAG